MMQRVDDVAKLIEASAELLNENVPVTAEPPQYNYTKLPSLRPALSRTRPKTRSRGPRCSLAPPTRSSEAYAD